MLRGNRKRIFKKEKKDTMLFRFDSHSMDGLSSVYSLCSVELPILRVECVLTEDGGRIEVGVYTEV